MSGRGGFGGPGPGGGPRGGGPAGSIARGIDRAKKPRETLARLAQYLLKYKTQLAIVVACVVISSLLQLAGPYVIGVTIDQYILKGDTPGLLRMSFLLLGIYLGSWATMALQGIIMAMVSQKALRQLRKELFEHIQTLSLSFFDRQRQGDLMSRLTNDIDAISNALTMNLVQIISSVFSLGGILVAMFLLNVWLALGTLSVLPVMVLITALVGGRTMKGFGASSRRWGASTGGSRRS